MNRKIFKGRLHTLTTPAATVPEFVDPQAKHPKGYSALKLRFIFLVEIRKQFQVHLQIFDKLELVQHMVSTSHMRPFDLFSSRI